MMSTEWPRGVLVALIFSAFLSSPASAWNLGAGLAASEGYFKAEEARKEQDYLERRRAMDLESQRQAIALQRMQIEAARRQQAQGEADNQEAAKQATATVQAAISRNKTLQYWQASDSAQWYRAKEIDAVLRALPENANLSLDERFAKVVRFVQAEGVAWK